MKIPSLADIKKELQYLDEKELTEVIINLSKFNRDNKAYLYFKLFERENPRIFIDMVKEDLDLAFMDANTKHYHLAKKSAQAIRRKLNKHLKLSKDKEAHAELILYFCEKMKLYGYLNFRHPVIENLYKIQLGKVEKIISGLHEDLQYDFRLQLESLNG
ncbi:hypothetical protein [Cecembia lonarensis]|uniref:Uncharacterized protein n=1 Tax=Cecembia lonarensis (strain CCUG 58316 / KCTC 22772 / LW9) TaxID=1225176 RepID=K1L862_CECL9|nr:hypothetical protein [Cecembia lonarensis]EKB50886.1 hypothetical protein B879_00414 [Cecembia lonarensis LW9]